MGAESWKKSLNFLALSQYTFPPPPPWHCTWEPCRHIPEGWAATPSPGLGWDTAAVLGQTNSSRPRALWILQVLRPTQPHSGWARGVPVVPTGNPPLPCTSRPGKGGSGCPQEPAQCRAPKDSAGAKMFLLDPIMASQPIKPVEPAQTLGVTSGDNKAEICIHVVFNKEASGPRWGETIQQF